jgi:hypothetical protein
VRILIVDTCYSEFLQAHYDASPELRSAQYSDQHDALMSRVFGTSDSYARHLAELGHTTATVVVNSADLQGTWAREHKRPAGGRALASASRLPSRAGRFAGKLAGQLTLEALIDEFDPDVVFVHDLWSISPRRLRRIRQGRFLVGQMASLLPETDILEEFDLMLSSFPHFVDAFSSAGLDAEYFAIGFYERAMTVDDAGNADPFGERPYAATFIGGIDPRIHRARTSFLEAVASRTDIDVWGYGSEALEPTSPLLRKYHGRAWGDEMYRVLGRSKIAVNRHEPVDVTGPIGPRPAVNVANNMRLYEATGMGALLMTEDLPNLSDHFEPGVEVVAYSDAKDLAEKIRYYLEHEDERVAIAAAGQRRTLRDHTYRNRMRELDALIGERLRYLDAAESGREATMVRSQSR